MRPISSKHHYLPEFYLNGFTGADGKFAVYDLQANRLKTKRLTPSQVFFEYDRNTFEVDGVRDDFVEQMYGLLETQIGRVFKKIREQEGFSILDEHDMFNIILFMGSLFWRIPITDVLIKDLIAKATPDELNFKIINKRTGEEAPQSFYDLLKGKDSFTASYRAIKPIVDYMKDFDAKKINHWQVYFAEKNDLRERKEMHLIGDNPIIFKQNNATNIFDQELIMPLTSGKTLYHTRGKEVNVIDPSPRIQVDRLIVLQSERYVCGPDANYLKNIVEQAYKFREISPDRAIEFLRHQVFNIFYD